MKMTTKVQGKLFIISGSCIPEEKNFFPGLEKKQKNLGIESLIKKDRS